MGLKSVWIELMVWERVGLNEWNEKGKGTNGRAEIEQN